jgi:hypothetical protein
METTMKELTPPQYIIDQFNIDRYNGYLMTDNIFLYWKADLCALLDVSGKRYSIAQLVEMVKAELKNSDTKMFKNQAIKMI